MVKVTIKWGNKKFENVEFDITKGVQAFRLVVQNLTNVPPDKQKMIFKGTILKVNFEKSCIIIFKDETDLVKLKIPEGASIGLTGSAEERIIQEPKKQITFLEDLDEDEIMTLHNAHAPSGGLTNLNETSYLNACIQCLRNIDEIHEMIKKFRPKDLTDKNTQFIIAVQRVFEKQFLRKNNINSIEVLNALIQLKPEYGTLDDNYNYQCHDAEVCLQDLLRLISEGLSANTGGSNKNSLESLFEIGFESRITPMDQSNEEPSLVLEKGNKLTCLIDVKGKNISTLSDGIAEGLKEIVEKQIHPELAPARYQKLKKIISLPKYIIVHQERFMIKEDNALLGSLSVLSKINKPINVQETFDALPFCTYELKEKLTAARRAQSQGKKTLNIDQDFILEEEEKAIKEFKEIGTGFYDLIAVISHYSKVATGQYHAWLKQGDGSWICYQDSNVQTMTLHDILNLKGGLSPDTGYIYFYRKVPFSQN